MNISENIMLGSGNKVSLLLPEQQITDTLNAGLNQFYGDLVKVVKVEELPDNTVRITMGRTLPYEFLLSGFISYIDASIITGLSEKCFMPGPEQIVFPTVPFGNAYFVPLNEFEKVYKKQLCVMVGAHVNSIHVGAMMTELIVKIEFGDSMNTPKKYLADIKSLTGKFGDLNLLNGQTVNMTLTELSKLCPRPQVKMEAYKGLVNYLEKVYEITMKITSNKSKTN